MISISKLCPFITKITTTTISPFSPPLKISQKPLPLLTITITTMSSSSSWSCSKCTFSNPITPTSSLCQICLSPKPQILQSPSPSTQSNPNKWSCAMCTFLNPYQAAICEICGARVSASLISALEIDDDEARSGASIGTVFLPLKRCSSNASEGSLGNGEKRDVGLTRCGSKRKERVEIDLDGGDDDDDDDDASGFRVLKSAKNKAVEVKSLAATGGTNQSSECKTWKVLSYNIWFREDLEMRERMRALGNLIELHSPDVICFQEVTPTFYEIFQKSRWWKGYRCSIPNEMAFPGGYFCMQLCKLPVKAYSCKPFHNSIMGRELCIAEIEIQPTASITVATSHLESPCPSPPKWDQMFSKERVVQANEAVRFLDKNRNVIFCGDMNWDDKLDGPFPLSDKWVDAWTELRPGEVGYTYDTKSNKMISGNRALQKRLDRFVCKLKDFKISKIEMIGVDEIPGLSYVKEKRVKGQVKEMVLPVLPSDHYGLLLTICPSD